MTDFRFALRSLGRVKGLAITVVLTLALGIGANAAIFSVVRGVLIRPLVNRDQDRLIYIRQSAPGNSVENSTFSVPEVIDLKERMKTLTAMGQFSTITFTMVCRGSPRPTIVKVTVEKSPSAETDFSPERRSWISGTENVVFSTPSPGALCLT